MLSQTVEYALRAAMYLAAEAPSTCTTPQVAEATKVPAAYLAKVLQSLSRAGIARSQRGVGGGISLNRDPSEITLFDVINAVEPLQRIKTCPLGLEEHRHTLCPLHRRLDNAMAEVENVFQSATLAELLEQKDFCPPPDEEENPPGEQPPSP